MKCPDCGATLKHHADNLERYRDPIPNEYLICVTCRAINIVTDDLELRRPTDYELAEGLKHPQLIAGIVRVAEYHNRGYVKPLPPGKSNL